jgi:2,5-diamino-6-(ribosylamino)-4(3H)-pyrimidinone 5'-phosphate reductase
MDPGNQLPGLNPRLDVPTPRRTLRFGELVAPRTHSGSGYGAAMDRPHVTVHSMVSMDGRTDHFAGDIGLYYRTAAMLPHDAVLAGSATLVAAARAAGVDLSDEDADVSATVTGDDVPWLVIVDSRGRISRFDWLRAQPHWRGPIVAYTRATPAAHLGLLDRNRVERLLAGDDRVDLAGLLGQLAARYGVARVRVDAGGTLNGVLLRAGLVDELSLLIAPYAVGGTSPRGVFTAADLPEGAEVARFGLVSVEQPQPGTVWLRYRSPESP